MTLQEAYEKRRQEALSLQRQVKKLQKELADVSAGLYTPDEKVAFLRHGNSGQSVRRFRNKRCHDSSIAVQQF